MTSRRIVLTLIGLVAAVVVAFPAAALATDGAGGTTNNETHNTTTEPKTGTTTESHDRASTVPPTTEKTEPSETGEHKLGDAKLHLCKARVNNINGVMNGSVARTEKQIQLFSTITERTEDFYTKKGKTVANYDELVAAVNNAKATAQTDVASLKSLVGTGFNCDGTDPKGTAASVKTAIEKVRNDMKAYKTAVKNLIVAVKSVQGDQ